MSSTHAERLGAFVADLSLDDFPDEAVEHARYLILDSAAVTLGGTRLRQGQAMTNFWTARGGAAEATVPGASEKLPLTTAAAVNSYLANVLDYDDTYSGRAIGHPGATVIPAALAVAEAHGNHDHELLTAILAGYEVSIRVGDAIMPSPERSQEVVGTGTWQIFGPAAATAKLLDLPPTSIADALGLAAMNAPVPLVRKVGIDSERFQWLKNNYGWTALGGVVAAELAAQGFRGSRDVFDGSTGFWRMAASDTFDSDVLHRPLDDFVAVTDVSFKPYSACRWTHATLDCIGTLAEEGLAPAEIDRIEVDTFHEAAALDTIPETVLDAQFSLPYVVAVSVLGYDPGFEWLSEERLTDPQVTALMERVEIAAADRFSSWYEESGQMAASVRLVLGDGSERTASTDHPRGDPEKPLPYPDVLEKYRTLAEPVIGESAAADLAAAILDLPADRPTTEIADLLGHERPPGSA